MADAKLYSVQDIEILKQKIATYRDTLTTLKSGNAIDDYLFMKSELTYFKNQVSHLEEVMEQLNDKRSMQIEEYEQQIETFSQQMDSLNQTVEELNQDLSVVIDQLADDRSGKVITTVAMRDSKNTNHSADEMEVIEVTPQLEKKTPISSIQQSNQPPSFKYLQSLIARVNDIQEVPSTVTSPASIHQNSGKPSFPSIGSHPTQIYNGVSRNHNMKSTLHFNNISTKQAIPIGRSDNLVPSISQPPIEPEKNEIMTAPLEEVHYKKTIEGKVHHLEKTEREINPEAVIEIPTETNPVAVIEIPTETNPIAVIEIPNEMKRQQHKNKDTLSLFNLFRRKS